MVANIDEFEALAAQLKSSQQSLRQSVREEHTTQSSRDGSMDSAKDYVDARLDAERARTEAQFAHVEARFAEVLSGIEVLKATSITRPQLWGAAGTIIAAVLGVMFAALAFAGDRFDGGIAASGMIREVQEAQEARDAAQDEKLGQILEAIQALGPAPAD